MTAVKKKTVETAAESAQAAPEVLGMSQGQEAPENASREILGPDDPEELLGCMEDVPSEDDVREGLVFHEFAVIAPGGLRLRMEPHLDAPVLSILPHGAGVWMDTIWDGEAEWLFVRTGTLAGWMMARYLAPVDLNGAE